MFLLQKNLSYMSLHVSLIRCKNEALKKLQLKSTIKCFKKAKICKWPEIPYSFSPIDCCVRINGQPDRYSVVIFSHRYLDRDRINFTTFVFLTVQWSIWTSSYNTDIKVKKKLNGASTMLNNVFKTLSNTVGVDLKIVELCWLCRCIMMFKRINKRPRIQQFWNLCFMLSLRYLWLNITM